MSASFDGDLLAHLHGFDAIARAVKDMRPHAFERAARELHVDPSVLRRRVRALADYLGAPLLSGRASRMTLTDAGARLEVAGRRILAAATALRDDIGEARATVIVGCTGTIATELVPLVVAALEQPPHRIDVRARRMGSAACLRAVEAGDVGVGVVRAGAPPPELAAIRLCDDRLWLVVPKADALATARSVSLDDIARAPLITYGETSQTRARTMAALVPRGVRVRAEVEDGRGAVAYVRLSLGVALLSRLPGDPPRGRAIVARDVTRLFPRLSFYAVTRRDASRSALAVAAALRRHVVERQTRKRSR